LSTSRLINRRESLAFAAWAVLGAGCDSSPSEPQSAAVKTATPGAAPEAGPTRADATLSDPDARRFYDRRGGKPAWTDAQAQELTHSFGEARRHGLDPAVFAIKPAHGDDPFQRDAAITLAALRFARALAFGFVDPQSIEKIFTLERNQTDLAAGLERALAGGTLADWLASLPPSDAEYKALSAAYLATIGRGGLASVPDRIVRCESPSSQSPGQGALGPATPPPTAPSRIAPDQGPSDQGAKAPSPTPPGAASQATPPTSTPQPPQNPTSPNAPPQSPAAPAAAPQGPAAQGPAPQNQPGQSPAADQTGATASQLPEENGATGAALPRRDRARQLAANLERRRWLSRLPPTTRIDVNTASCIAVYRRPGNDPWSARIVCGKIGHETPSIQGFFRRLVTNPVWRVPMDIARREIFPKGGGYLRRENMHVVDGRVVQRPGPRNALGLVKFDVQDPYAIYLHDTPSKSLFALPERHKSHGCVRVQNAVGLARQIAEQNGKADAFDKALGSGKTDAVELGEDIPVRLLYHTAFADETGQVTFVPDVYGWNDKLATALGRGPPMDGVHRAASDADIGP
jgi:murein L,D-transpeptidase YcbB/YkuD